MGQLLPLSLFFESKDWWQKPKFVVQTGRRGSHTLFSSVAGGFIGSVSTVPVSPDWAWKGDRPVLSGGWEEPVLAALLERDWGEAGGMNQYLLLHKQYVRTGHYGKFKGKILLLKGYLPWGNLIRNICQMKRMLESYPSAVIGDCYHVCWQFHAWIGQMPKRSITHRT